MSAELWVKRPCKHGIAHDHVIGEGIGPTYRATPCPGGSEERLDPDRVVAWHRTRLTVQDVLDTLEEQ